MIYADQIFKENSICFVDDEYGTHPLICQNDYNRVFSEKETIKAIPFGLSYYLFI